MMTRKSEVKVSESQMFHITRKDENVLKLPVKAIGTWVVVKESMSVVRLRKVRQDGYLASDKGNNFQVVSQKQFEVIKRNNDILKFQSVFVGISKRKREWVEMLLKLFNDSKELKLILKKFGKYNIAKQILFDSDATKTPVYNSTKQHYHIGETIDSKIMNQLVSNIIRKNRFDTCCSFVADLKEKTQQYMRKCDYLEILSINKNTQILGFLPFCKHLNINNFLTPFKNLNLLILNRLGNTRSIR